MYLVGAEWAGGSEVRGHTNHVPPTCPTHGWARQPPRLTGQHLPHSLELRLWGEAVIVGGHRGAQGKAAPARDSPAAPGAESSPGTAPPSAPAGPACNTPGWLSWGQNRQQMGATGDSLTAPSPLTGAGLASGPQGCAGSGPQPLGPPGPVTSPPAPPALLCSMLGQVPAPCWGWGHRGQHGAAPGAAPPHGDPPHSPGRCWVASGRVLVAVWLWGGSAWLW